MLKLRDQTIASIYDGRDLLRRKLADYAIADRYPGTVRELLGS